MNIHSLRKLPSTSLIDACKDLRSEVIQTVEKVGGHLGGNLGVIELTVALHYVFDTPKDKLIWDVGHQAYAHKLLTNRNLHTIRQYKGISGFPKRNESEYDAFGTGHSSTSISAALGMAIAEKQLNPRSTKQHIAVIGDGALTAGMAYEALHHAVTTEVNLLIILNDNGMSISPNVGGMSELLNDSNRTKSWFKGLGICYFGDVDGNDIDSLLIEINKQKEQSGVRLLHVKTQKGYGYSIMNGDKTRAHAIKPVLASTHTNFDTYSDLLSLALCELAEKDNRLHVITPAMIEGSGLVTFSKHYPDQLTDVGIAEQHAVTLAAGMACTGVKPVVAIYSTFLQRGYDQLIHDVALQNLDVTFMIDRAGIVGEDGATHTGAFDIAFSRCVPNITIATPADAEDFTACFHQCYNHPFPTLLRYPKGKTTSLCLPHAEFGKGCVIRQGEKIAILAFGTLIEQAIPVANQLNLTVVNMRYIKPLDISLLEKVASTHEQIVTIEEGTTMGGVGEYIAAQVNIPVNTLGILDRVVQHGTRTQILTENQLLQPQLLTVIKDLIKK